MRTLVLLLTSVALSLQASCPGCPLEVRALFPDSVEGVLLFISVTGANAGLRTGGSC